MLGATLGIVVSIVIGYGIYRGGVKINMARFFRVTGIVLVLVAAGLLATAAHTAHEAGWLNVLQGQALEPSVARAARQRARRAPHRHVRPATAAGMGGGHRRGSSYAVPFLVIVARAAAYAGARTAVGTTHRRHRPRWGDGSRCVDSRSDGGGRAGDRGRRGCGSSSKTGRVRRERREGAVHDDRRGLRPREPRARGRGRRRSR